MLVSVLSFYLLIASSIMSLIHLSIDNPAKVSFQNFLLYILFSFYFIMVYSTMKKKMIIIVGCRRKRVL